MSFEPNSSFEVAHAEYSHRVTIDDLGGRRVSPQGHGRVLPCLGDSFTFGVGVKDEETFVSLLQSRVPVRLVNLGVPGSALHTQRRILEGRFSELGSPGRVVVFFFLGNDFEDLRKAGEAPSDLPSQHRGVPWLVNDLVNNSPLRRSYLLQSIKHGLLKRAPDQPRNPVFWLMDTRNTAYLEQASRALATEVHTWSRLRESLEVTPLFVLIPDVHQIDQRRRELQAGFYGIPQDSLHASRPNRVAAQALGRAGFEVVDVTEELSQDGSRGLYYVNDNHLTAAGHARFAQCVGAKIADWLAR